MAIVPHVGENAGLVEMLAWLIGSRPREFKSDGLRQLPLARTRNRQTGEIQPGHLNFGETIRPLKVLES